MQEVSCLYYIQESSTLIKVLLIEQKQPYNYMRPKGIKISFKCFGSSKQYFNKAMRNYSSKTISIK